MRENEERNVNSKEDKRQNKESNERKEGKVPEVLKL